MSNENTEYRDTDVPLVAVLEHLTGPSAGKTTWIGQAPVDITLDKDLLVHIFRPGPGRKPDKQMAQIVFADDSFHINAAKGKSVWVNGKRIQSRQLKSHDMIEFGNEGPISRFLIFEEGKHLHQPLAAICSDTIAYLKTSRQPKMRRIFRAAGQFVRRLLTETTLLFRIGVVVTLAILTFLAYQQRTVTDLQQRQINISAEQLDSFSRTIGRVRQESLSQQDLAILRQEMARQNETTAKRFSELEDRSKESGKTIAKATRSVAFLLGAYGYREVTTGRMLRHALDDKGKPISLPNGSPMLTLEGKGQIAERQYTGSAFVVKDREILVTNRHLGYPWEIDANTNVLAVRGLEPVVTKFLAYFPGITKPVNVELISVSDRVDLALLRLLDPVDLPEGLQLAAEPPALGDEIFVLGYPTGMRSMLAQAGKQFLSKLQQDKTLSSWDVAARLAEFNRITPLTTKGIVGRVSEETIVYDAETTSGGSGGPVVDRDGRVVAVTAAILPEFGGSNLGVPVAEVQKLLEQRGY